MINTSRAIASFPRLRLFNYEFICLSKCCKSNKRKTFQKTFNSTICSDCLFVCSFFLLLLLFSFVLFCFVCSMKETQNNRLGKPTRNLEKKNTCICWYRITSSWNVNCFKIWNCWYYLFVCLFVCLLFGVDKRNPSIEFLCK